MLNITKKNLILDILTENNIILVDNNKVINTIEQEITENDVIDFEYLIESNSKKLNIEEKGGNQSDKNKDYYNAVNKDELNKKNIKELEENSRTYENKQYKVLNEKLCVLIQNGKEDAKEVICKKNRQLVYNIAKYYVKYFNHKLEIDDLFQVGMIGLLKAAEKFDVQRDTTFCTYATFWIRQYIIRTILDTGLEIRVPVHMIDTINKVNKESMSLNEKNFEKDKKIAEKLSIPTETVRKSRYIFNYILNTVSLDDEIGHEHNSTLKDMMVDNATEIPENIMLKHKLYKYIDDILYELSTREREIILYRFGLNQDSRTLNEIGQIYGLTRERIRQIEDKVLKKLKVKAKRMKLEDYLNEH